MEIKKVTQNDYPRLRKLYLDVRRERFTWLDPAALREEDFDADTEGEDIYGAWAEGELAGFITVWAPDAFIHLLFVGAKFRGRRIGTELLRTAARTYGLPLTLKCVKENRQAVNFYLAHGWTIEDEGKSPEGAYYLMRREAAKEVVI